jgi:sodium/proline symporter
MTDHMDVVALSFALYTLAIVAFGVYSARFAQATSVDFLLAGRGLGAWVSSLSAAASAESGWVTLGLVGMSFQTGLAALWIIPGTLAAFLFNWLVLGEPLRRASAEGKALTLVDVLARGQRERVAALIRVVAVALILTMLTTYIAAQLNAAGKAFAATFGWSYHAGVLAGAAIVLVYTVTGGFRAVAWTDVAQAILMVAAVILLPVVLIAHLGGPAGMIERLEALPGGAALTDPLGGKGGMALVGFLAVCFGIPLGYPGQPHLLIRFMATRDQDAIRRGATISTIWVLFLFAGAVLLGVSARAYYGALPDPEKALPIAAADLLPAPLAGLMMAAVIAAIASTADSQLLVTASTISHDLFARLLRRPARAGAVGLHRLSVLGVAAAATGIALSEARAVFHFVLYAWDALGAAFGPAVILSLTWRRVTGWGILAGMITGAISVIVWRETLHAHFYALIPGFLLATAAIVGVSLAARRG